MIVRFVIAVIVVYLLYRLIQEFRAMKAAPKTRLPASGEDLVEDPWCHTLIPMSDALRISENGKTFYFCSRECLEQYCDEKKGRA